MSFATDYSKTIRPQLLKDLQLTNVMRVPALKKIIVNVGSGEAMRDDKLRSAIEQTLQRITGQKPLARKAKKSISNFKLRQNSVIGWKVTLRGKRMYDFFEKLVRSTLPRVRDFRGVPPTGFDGHGNYTLGFKEHLVFPEIRPDEVEKVHGLEVSIQTSAANDDEGRALLKAFGFPFATSDVKSDQESLEAKPKVDIYKPAKVSKK